MKFGNGIVMEINLSVLIILLVNLVDCSKFGVKMVSCLVILNIKMGVFLV